MLNFILGKLGIQTLLLKVLLLVIAAAVGVVLFWHYFIKPKEALQTVVRFQTTRADSLAVTLKACNQRRVRERSENRAAMFSQKWQGISAVYKEGLDENRSTVYDDDSGSDLF